MYGFVRRVVSCLWLRKRQRSTEQSESIRSTIDVLNNEEDLMNLPRMHVFQSAMRPQWFIGSQSFVFNFYCFLSWTFLSMVRRVPIGTTSSSSSNHVHSRMVLRTGDTGTQAKIWSMDGSHRSRGTWWRHKKSQLLSGSETHLVYTITNQKLLLAVWISFHRISTIIRPSIVGISS